jgi:hypothetical protein
MIKETFGPFLLEESCFNPVEILLDAGVAADNLHLLTISRDPIETASSWMRINKEIGAGADSSALKPLTIAYRNTVRLAAYAKDHNIAHTPFVYELLRDHDAAQIYTRLAAQLNISPSGKGEDWRALPPVEAPSELIKYVDQGRRYDAPDLHTKLNQSLGLTYYSKSVDELMQYLDASHLSFLTDEGAFDDYRAHQRMSAAAFGLPIRDLRSAILLGNTPLLPPTSGSRQEFS